jgi:hypothetical protein
MILMKVGRRTDEHYFRREAGIGSKSQLVSGESDSSLEISSMVTGLKVEKFGGPGNVSTGASMIEKTSVWFVNLISEKGDK